MKSTRRDLDLSFIIQALLNERSYTDIAIDEGDRLGKTVTRNQIASVARDLKNGKLRSKEDNRYFSYGKETDNGGVPVYDGVIRFHSDKVLVIGDMHFPYNSRDLTDTLPDVINYYGITHIVFAGDLIDAQKQSTFPSVYTDGITLANEENSARDTLIWLFETCPTLTNAYYMRGNHEDRPLKKQNGHMDFVRYARGFLHGEPFVSKFVITPYTRIEFVNGGEVWTVVHPKAKGDVHKTRTAEDLAFKHQTNIVMTHIHKNAMQRDRYGHFKLVVVGGGHDPQLQGYIQLETSKNPKQEQGYATFVHGSVKLWTFDDLFTDWGDIL